MEVGRNFNNEALKYATKAKIADLITKNIIKRIRDQKFMVIEMNGGIDVYFTFITFKLIGLIGNEIVRHNLVKDSIGNRGSCRVMLEGDARIRLIRLI